MDFGSPLIASRINGDSSVNSSGGILTVPSFLVQYSLRVLLFCSKESVVVVVFAFGDFCFNVDVDGDSVVFDVFFYVSVLEF